MKAIIFDLDGCLVDSESLALSVIATEMRRLGAKDVSEHDLGKTLLGYNMSQIANFVGQAVGAPAPADFPARINGQLMQRYPQELQAMTGATALLSRLSTFGCDMAVATGSSIARMTTALQVSRLDHFFNGRACSSDQVEHGKPAPDIFLYAADLLHRAPQECLVLEDSPHGVAAAISAGMTPVGFVGGSHLAHRKDEHAETLRAAGCVHIFHSLDALEQMVQDNAPLLR